MLFILFYFIIFIIEYIYIYILITYPDLNLNEELAKIALYLVGHSRVSNKVLLVSFKLIYIIKNIYYKINNFI